MIFNDLLNITLISYFHKIHGNFNIRGLYKIIEYLQPDVIFEELSTNSFGIIYSPHYKPETIELITIKQYLQKYPIKHLSPSFPCAKPHTGKFPDYFQKNFYFHIH